jgi:hypothetical protein
MVEMRSVRAISLPQAVVALATLLCVLVGVVIVGAASARADSFSWSSPIALGITGTPGGPGAGEFPRVACPSAVQCTAVNSAGREVTFNPSAPASAAPTTIDSSPGPLAPDCPIQIVPQCLPPVELVGPVPLACASVSQCTAVDGKGQEVTFNPSAAGNPVPIKLSISILLGVACPTASQCTAVDDDGQEVTFNPTAPGNPVPIGILGGDLGAVACPTASQCTAVDTGAQEVTFNPLAPGSSTSTTIDGADSFSGVACPSVSQCTAVDHGGHEVTFNPTAPNTSTAATIDGSGDLQGVACPSVLQCTAIDRDGREVTFDPTAPTDSVATAIAGASSLDSIACASVAECVVVDSAGDAFVGFVGVTPPPSITAVHQPPSITAVHQSHSIWREGSAPAHASARKTLPVGTTFSFSLNESATVTFEFSESASGRKVRETCLAQTRKNKKDPSCTRTVLAGTLRFAAHSGENKVHFEGLILRHKKLKPGSYALLVTATASGEHSAPRTLHFTIVSN